MLLESVDVAAGNKTEIDIEKIMDEIRADIEARGFVDDCVPFDAIDLNELKPLESVPFNLQTMELELSRFLAVANINPYREIGAKRGLIGKLSRSFKKMVQRCINFHITPIVWDITASNNQALEFMRCCRDFAKQQIDEEVRLDTMEHEINYTLKKSNLLLEQKVNQIVRQNQELLSAIKTLEIQCNELIEKQSEVSGM